MADETEEEAEKRVAMDLEALLSKESMGLAVTIIKQPIPGPDGTTLWVDMTRIEVKRKRSLILTPSSAATEKRAVSDILRKVP